MRVFKKGDAVSFDISFATGTGIVVESHSGQCDISATTIDFKKGCDDDFADMYDESEPCLLDDIPDEDLTIISEDDWTDALRQDYVEFMISDESGMEDLSEEDKDRVRKHLDVLCSHNDITALKKKGYLCYGGSPLYECDWTETVRCFEKVLQAEMDTDIANSLGYIYYYGRTNNGVPDYDKSYRYFSIAAIDGNHESLYKVGDMFLKGLGVPPCPEYSEKLYSRVYNESRILLLSGYLFNKFADAALRMASTYERNGARKSRIYGKYLEADLGLELRSKYHCYGDNSVRKAVDAGLEKFKNESIDSDRPYIFSSLDKPSLRGNLLSVKLERKGQVVKGKVSIVSPETKRKSWDAYLLLTIPELSYCGFVRSFSFSCILSDSWPEIEDGDDISFYCDYVSDDYSDVMFISEKEDFMLSGSEWKIKIPTKADEFQPEWLDI